MKRVMIVDDNQICSEGICKNINWKSIDAEICGIYTNGKDALSQLEKIKPDIIISDIQMPQMNGIELAKVVLNKYPFIKVIFISSYDDFNYAKEAIRLDVCDYVEKPIDYQYLFQIIQQTLHKSDLEKDTLERLQQSKPALMEKFFLDLINAGSDYAEYTLGDQAAYLDLDFSAQEYVCVYIDIHKYLDQMKLLGVERYHMQIFHYIKTVENVLTKQCICYTINQGSRLIFLIGSINRREDGLIPYLIKKFTNIKEDFQFQSLTKTIGIGNIVPSIWEISLSYQNAKHANGYKFILGEDSILSIQDIRQNNPFPIVFPLGDEEKFINFIAQKDINSLKDFTNLLEKRWTNDYYNKNGIIAYVYSLLSRLLRFLYDIGIEDQEIRYEMTTIFMKLEELQTSKEICSYLFEICVFSCQLLEDSVQSKHKQVAEQVSQYIETHYHDFELNLNKIGQFVNMSSSYLGTLFKRTKGKSISKYITLVRINKAKELLKNTNSPIMEISEKVGYSNQYYFSASFKKITGITPSEFRTAAEKKASSSSP